MLTIAVAVLLAMAMPIAPARAQDGPAHCIGVSAQLMAGAIAAGKEEETIAKSCRVGDTVWFPGRYTIAIARICDYSRQIVVLPGGMVTCVVAPLRSMRSPK